MDGVARFDARRHAPLGTVTLPTTDSGGTGGRLPDTRELVATPEGVWAIAPSLQLVELDRPDLWVRRVCANLAVSSFRRRMVELRAVTRLAGRRGLEPLSEGTEEVWAAVRVLPKRQAQSAALRFVYDLPIADIAVVLGCSEGTVKQHLSRARAALRHALDLEWEGDPS